MKRCYNPHTNESTHQTDAAMRFKCPYDNLLYAVLIRAALDGDTEYLRKGDALNILNGGCFKTRDGVAHIIKKWDLIIAHPRAHI